MKTTPLKFASMLGEGIGPELWDLALLLMEKLKIPIDPFVIKQFRDNEGNLLPSVVDTFKKYGLGIKGPTETPNGDGPVSANVALRQALNLNVNKRSINWIPGVSTLFSKPELINITVYRENTEDVYAGIEWKAGSKDAEKLRKFLLEEMDVPHEKLAYPMTGLGVKTASKHASDAIMKFAIEDMLRLEEDSKLMVMNKGNIMKYTEGWFKECCFDVARTYSACWGEDIGRLTKGKLHISSVTADDAFQKPILYPGEYHGIVTPNLNGDYIADMIAALVGGANLSSGANIGLLCAIFEAIGGTAKKLVGKNEANPTAYLLALADMFQHAKWYEEARLIRNGIYGALKEGYGTADICPDSPLTSEAFTLSVADAALQMAA